MRRDYVLLATNVPAQASGQITALDLPGVYQTASYARSYPEGSVAANLVGFTGTNKDGVISGGGGLEAQYNSLLAGKSGSEQLQIGDGQQIPLAGGKSTPAVNGRGLRLTIVPALQYAAEEACAEDSEKGHACGGHGGEGRTRVAHSDDCEIKILGSGVSVDQGVDI